MNCSGAGWATFSWNNFRKDGAIMAIWPFSLLWPTKREFPKIIQRHSIGQREPSKEVIRKISIKQMEPEVIPTEGNNGLDETLGLRTIYIKEMAKGPTYYAKSANKGKHYKRR